MTTEVATKKLYTVSEYMALPDDGKEYELINGELKEMPGPSFIHGKIIGKVLTYLNNYLDSKPVGQAISGTACVFRGDYAPRPDVAFIAAERTQSIDEFDAFPGPPDLAVEVLSRTDSTFEVEEKIQEYLKAGTRLVWLINPHSKLVLVYRPATDLTPQVIGLQGELDGENVIPGFKLLVNKLFE